MIVDCDEYQYSLTTGRCYRNGTMCPHEPACHDRDAHYRAERERANRLDACLRSIRDILTDYRPVKMEGP